MSKDTPSSRPTPMCGIYRITNTATGHVYIGSSKHVHMRWSRHRQALTSRTHHSVVLQRAWLKHGPEAFTCGQAFRLKPSQHAEGKRFCSIFRRDADSRTARTRNCTYCGAAFVARSTYVKAYFCSAVCGQRYTAAR